MKQFKKARFRSLVLTSLAVVALIVAGREAPTSQSFDLAILGGTLIDGTGAAPRPGVNIIVSGGRITRVGPSASTPPAADARVIHAEGKYVVPGLWDAHIHSRDYYAQLLMTHGITSYVDWGGSPMAWTLAMKDAVNKGSLYGPRIFTAGDWLRDVPSPEAARRQVRLLKERGVDMIAVGFGTERETLLAAIDEARKVGLPCVGYPVYAREAIEAGISGIKHTFTVGSANVTDPATRAAIEKEPALRDEDREARLYLLGDDYDELARLMVKNKTVWIPTFVMDFKVILDRRDEFELESYRLLSNPNLQYLPILNILPQLTNDYPTGIPWLASGNIGTVDRTSADWPRYQHAYKNLEGLLKKLVDGGAHVLPGTAPHAFVMPGLGMHQELQLFVDAGMTTMQALQSATLWSAQFARVDQDLGTIAEGKIADVVILRQDPLQNIRNLRTVDTVIQGGKVQQIGYHWYYRHPLQRTQASGPRGEGPRAPELTSITPTITVEGAQDTMVTLNGRNFTDMSVAFLDLTPLETTVVSPTELKAVVPGRLTRAAGTFSIRVRTPRPGGGDSESIAFTVKFP